MSFEKALIIEAEAESRVRMSEILKQKRLEISYAKESQMALDLVRSNLFDLIICSIALPENLLISLLKVAKEQHSQVIVIITATYRQVAQATEAMRLGAFNYLIKPFSNESVEAMLDKAQEHLVLLRENDFLKQEISTARRQKDYLIAESDMMRKILSDVSKIAKSSASVFISGESGTGKEVIAHAIHHQSQRATKGFIKVNCAAIPATLMESEFFGHEKGAFTGAINRRMGRFELADQGTLLLDEISEIPLELQPKLLRAVQEMEFERVGGVRSIRVDVRLISTSNRSMKETIEQKLFREDLYYRLNVVPIHLPPLRNRREDIIPLAEFFLERLCVDNAKSLKILSSEAKQLLLDYHWPGNIRELANVIERGVVMAPAHLIEPDYLHFDGPKSCPAVLPIGVTLKEVEKRMILETLEREKNNRTKAAQVLGISVRTLRNKLKEWKQS